MAKPWNEVEQSLDYQSLPPQEKMAAKQQYFNEVVAVKPEFTALSPAEQGAAQQEFFGGVAPQASQLRPMGYSRSGTPIYDPIALERAKQSIKNPIETQVQKDKAEIEQSKRTSQYNLDLVTQNVYDLGDMLARSWEEGGAGNALKKVGTQLAQKGVVVGSDKKYKTSAALVGKRTELVSKMLPMLTQQIGKEGSVRLVESVFRKLGQTIPDEATPPRLAKEQMYQSLLSMYRTRRALEQIDLRGVKNLNGETLASFASEIANKIGQIELSPIEQKAFENMAAKALAPIDIYYAKSGMLDMLRSFKNAKEAEEADLPVGSIAIIAGKVRRKK